MRLRTLSEAECYARCYGAFEDAVRVVKLGAERGAAAPSLTGEAVRLLFEERLELREPDAEAA
ncbi:MAG TPA: hypothetical protein VK874_08445 [Gaiellaceae bacterium]|nr:hypothetical protein [Gaiellaceae bacterium]